MPLVLAAVLQVLTQETPRPESRDAPRVQESTEPEPSPDAAEGKPQTSGRDAGDDWSHDPNRTRYLYMPSGMMLHQGEGSVAQTEVFLTMASYGLTDHLTLQAGAALPGWFVRNSFNFAGGIKVGGSLGDRWHLAAGVQGLFFPNPAANMGLIGLAYGTATYGTASAHLSLTVGTPYQVKGTPEHLAFTYLFALSGNLRVGQHVALVTENWLVPIIPYTSVPMLNAAGVRLFGEHWAVSLGLIRLPWPPSVFIIPAVPWVDFAYNFGS